MIRLKYLLFVFLLNAILPAKSQDLLDLFEEEETTEYTTATFKTTRIINGQSIENPPAGELLFVISHRFGTLNSGAYEFFGLDQGFIRLGFEYGIFDRLGIGIGRSVYEKTFDGFFKFKLIRQSTGKRTMPFSMSWFSNISLNSLKWLYPERENYFTSRLSYAHTLLIARKFNNRLSWQFSPSMIHRNLVETLSTQNDVFALGTGGRLKITQRLSLNAEYFYLLPGKTADEFNNSLSIGIDIETGGHVFQLHITNSLGMFEEAFITETTGNWLDGGIHFGFNISRIFNIKKEKTST